ncbi:MAG: hypothetical protein K2J90_00645 [Lachnospiraceae bacterium]|nr:hypothetical protein [Lachnospiraceae bacterium]
MKDVFYLCSKSVNIINIYALFQINNIECKCFGEMGVIQIRKDKQFINLTLMRKEEFEDKDKKIFLEKGIRTIVCISYNTYSIEELKNILFVLLDNEGGLIGNDSDEFEPILSISNIMEFQF